MRDEIHESKKLNVHLYNSIKKSLYKPAAFFKGFLFPLAEVHTILPTLLSYSAVSTDQ